MFKLQDEQTYQRLQNEFSQLYKASKKKFIVVITKREDYKQAIFSVKSMLGITDSLEELVRLIEARLNKETKDGKACAYSDCLKAIEKELKGN